MIPKFAPVEASSVAMNLGPRARFGLLLLLWCSLTLGTACSRRPEESAPPATHWTPGDDARDTAFALSLERVRQRFTPDGRVERRGPFVVGAPDDDALWKRYVDGSLLGAARRLQQQFFRTHPSGPIEVYLFQGNDAYQTGVRALTGEAPSTPYGFYQSVERRLILDIGTGGGTLVHELVHALTDVDCPSLPAWINEGLGSLYEACRFEERRLVGTPNWRLPVLQRAWDSGDWQPTISELPTLDDDEFYGVLSGRHYALARYAMFYLQDRGVLERFYQAYRDQAPPDPSGKAALESALGSELTAHTESFQAFLKALR